MITFTQTQQIAFSILYLQKYHVDRVIQGINLLTALNKYCKKTEQNTFHIPPNISNIPTHNTEGITIHLFLEQVFMRGNHLLIINLD